MAAHREAALRRVITHRYAGDLGALAAYLLDPVIEDAIRDAVQKCHGQLPGARAPAVERHRSRRRARGGPGATAGAVLLTGTEIRRYARRLIEGEHPKLAMLSFEELVRKPRFGV